MGRAAIATPRCSLLSRRHFQMRVSPPCAVIFLFGCAGLPGLRRRQQQRPIEPACGVRLPRYAASYQVTYFSADTAMAAGRQAYLQPMTRRLRQRSSCSLIRSIHPGSRRNCARSIFHDCERRPSSFMVSPIPSVRSPNFKPVSPQSRRVQESSRSRTQGTI